MKVNRKGQLHPGEAVDRILALRADREARAIAAAERVRTEDLVREATLVERVPEGQRPLLEQLLSVFPLPTVAPVAEEPAPEAVVAPEPEPEPQPSPTPPPPRRSRRRTAHP